MKPSIALSFTLPTKKRPRALFGCFDSFQSSGSYAAGVAGVSGATGAAAGTSSTGVAAGGMLVSSDISRIWLELLSCSTG